ncbi:ABC transporter ATP-binding protein [Aestuariimicrobium ganziense]|uniref:ABC transporter ATP-binding protein n=1 Tax=Aestuariimicrobium ganziense TaxID=2773677 RepID=UPI002E2DD5EB|nr:ABC transporter ATP-binding protein [Aestuariimicrobium ganziense]
MSSASGSDTTSSAPNHTVRLYGDALDRPPLIDPRRTSTRRNPAASLMRLTPYLKPYAVVFFSMLGLALVAVLLSILTPLITRRIIDGPVVEGDKEWLFALGAVALVIGLGESMLNFIRRWTMGPAMLGMETGIRLDMYAKLQRLPMSFHSRWQSGQLLSRIMSDLSTIRRFSAFGLTFMIVNTVQIIVVTILLINMYWPLGVVVLLSVIPVVWLCLANERVYTKLSRRIQDETGDVASSVEESIQGLRVVKAFGRVDHVFNRFTKRAQSLHDTSIERVRNVSKFWTFLEVIPTLTMIIVLAIGAVAAAQERLTLGTLVAFITLMLSLIWPIAALGFLLSMAQDAMTAADRICEMFDAEETIVGGDVVLDDPKGALRFENVAFQFHDADRPVLHDLNLDIRPGETIALVGGTGSGKSTLTALVPRLADVTAGRITLDGVDIRDLDLVALRRMVATAFEDPTLFSMSVRENLTLGRPDATEDEIAEAIEVAQAGFVHDLPWGLDTRIGEQGMSLSGGQRQRLALARAVLVRPAVLVLDDTLSALDIHTEALVEEALKRVLVGVTGIVVAHRASTVLLADRVAMLEDGTITHVGTHHDLLATVPEYRELLSADFDAEEVLDGMSPSERELAEMEGSLR